MRKILLFILIIFNLSVFAQVEMKYNANSKNLLVHLGNDPFDETSGFMLEDATFGTLLLDGTDIFGTDDFSKIQEHLIVDDSTDPPFLAYEGEAGGERLRLARIDIRQDGLGYGGGSMRFDLNMADDFADRLEEANRKVYGEKKEQYESLEGMISRMKRS